MRWAPGTLGIVATSSCQIMNIGEDKKNLIMEKGTGSNCGYPARLRSVRALGWIDLLTYAAGVESCFFIFRCLIL